MTGPQTSVPDLLRKLHLHMEVGDRQAAADTCTAILRLEPDHPTASLVLADTLARGGLVIPAALLLERAVVRDPSSLPLLVRLAQLLVSAGDLDAAHAAAQRAAALAPRDVAVLGCLGSVQEARGNVPEAAATYNAIVTMGVHVSEGLFHLTNIKMDQGETEDAQRLFADAVASDPEYHLRHRSAATALSREGHRERGATIASYGLQLGARDPELGHLAAALRGASADRASDEYVRAHFDGFARTYDLTLTKTLKYRAPQVLCELLERGLRQERRTGLTILDAGCGTGLSGIGVRGWADRLVGVDLSPAMLERASDRGVYDKLEEDEICAYLRRSGETYDVVLAADVLPYFGDLDEFVRLAAGVLRPRGHVAVTIEANEAGGPVLQASGRWSHPPSAIGEAAAAAGLAVIDTRTELLRYELGETVLGAYFLLAVEPAP